MKSSSKPTIIFLLYLCIAGPFTAAVAAEVAADCAAFRTDISSLQTAIRNADIEKSDRGLSRIADVSRQMKDLCLNNIVSVDASAFGLGNMGTQLVMQAAAKMCDQIADRVNTAGQSVSNSLSSQAAGVSQYTNALPQMVSTVNPAPSATTSTESDIWTRLRQLVQ